MNARFHATEVATFILFAYPKPDTKNPKLKEQLCA